MEDRALVSKRYERSFGITLEEREAMGDVCGICGRTRKTGEKRLHVDHDHRVARMPVRVEKQGKAWRAVVVEIHPLIIEWGTSRKEARKKARRELLRRSVRGILCWGCNSAIQKFRDDPVKMESAAKYIRKYQAKLAEGKWTIDTPVRQPGPLFRNILILTAVGTLGKKKETD